MKAWSLQIALGTLMFVCCGAHYAVAQDAGMSDVDIPAAEVSARDHAGFVPGEEPKFIPRASDHGVIRDSASFQKQEFPMQRGTARGYEKAAEKQSAKGKDDSVLTFNFLYYIIQKYKLQDIID